MAFSDDRWTTAFPCEPMFEASEVEKERVATLKDYGANSDYSGNRLMACYPCWWDNVESDRKAECELMCQHFLDPYLQQLSLVYDKMKTDIQIVHFNGIPDGKGNITTTWSDRCWRTMIGMPVLNSVSIGSNE